MATNRGMSYSGSNKGKLKVWVEMPGVSHFKLIAFAAMLGTLYCRGANANAGGVATSAEAKMGVRTESLRFVEHRSPAGVSARIFDGEHPVFGGITQDASLLLVQPTGRVAIAYSEAKWQNGELILTGATNNGLALTESFRTVAPDLIERTVAVTATSDQRYYLDLGWSVAVAGGFFSFIGKEEATKAYTPTCAGPEFGGGSYQTFPFLARLRGFEG